MKNGGKGALLVWALLLQAGAQAGAAPSAEPVPAAAKPDAPSGAEVAANPLRVTLESKLRLVELLLTQSPAVQRIPQSNNAVAKKELFDARELYTKGKAESNAGRPEAAIQRLDEALRHIVSASNRVPDVAQQAAQERRRNTDLREAIRTFQTLHKQITSRLSTRKVQTSADAADIGRIDAMMDQADTFISGGNQHEANVVLNNAYRIVVSRLNKMLAAETISYHLKFDSPDQEFQHELARNRSYEELIPLALVQLNTPRETATLVERYVQQSRDLREAAQKHASGGDHRTAVITLQDATSRLQRSLRIAGVVVPQTPETQP